MHACSVASVMSDSATLWTVARQASLSVRFSRQEYWSGLPGPPPGNLSNPGIKPKSPSSPVLQADSLLLSHWGNPKLTFTTASTWMCMGVTCWNAGSESGGLGHSQKSTFLTSAQVRLILLVARHTWDSQFGILVLANKDCLHAELLQSCPILWL